MNHSNTSLTDKPCSSAREKAQLLTVSHSTICTMLKKGHQNHVYKDEIEGWTHQTAIIFRPSDGYKSICGQRPMDLDGWFAFGTRIWTKTMVVSPRCPRKKQNHSPGCPRCLTMLMRNQFWSGPQEANVQLKGFFQVEIQPSLLDWLDFFLNHPDHRSKSFVDFCWQNLGVKNPPR